MQFQMGYLQQCSFWHPVLLWLTFSGLISSKSLPVVCVPARMEHTRMWFCYMLFMALSLLFLLLNPSLDLFYPNNIVFLFMPQHWVPLLFLAYNSLLCSVWHLSFLSSPFSPLFPFGTLAYAASNVCWTQKSESLLFHLGTESGIFLICLPEWTGKCLNRLSTALGVGLFLLKIALQSATTYMLSKCTTKYYPSSGLFSSKSPLLLI